MIRFLIGLVLGGCAFGITYAATSSPHWGAVAGITVAVLAWFGEFILDDLL